MASEGNEKRLVPEILPVPTRDPGSAGPRERMRSHMKQMLAAAAASTVIAGCSGYAVVDPIPPPARCPGLSGLLTVHATWKDDAGKKVIEVLIQRPANRSDVHFLEDNTPTGAKVLTIKGGDVLSLTVQPDAQATSANIRLSLSCSAAPQSDVFLQLSDLPADPSSVAAGTPVNASLSDF